MKLNSLFILSSILLSSCASIVSKTNWPLTINSNPSGAQIVVTNRSGVEVYKGNTPASMTLKSGAGFFKKESYKVKFTMTGYDIKEIPIECKLNGWYFGNILIGGLIGMLIVDPATGAMYKLDKEIYTETLTKSTTSSQSLKIYGLNEVPEHIRTHLIKIN